MSLLGCLSMMKIKSFYEPESGTWTHLLADSAEQKAAIIDPVWTFDPASGRADPEFINQVLEEAQNAGFTIEWVLETHAHADHLTAADLVKQQTGAKIACGKGICEVQKNFTRVFDMVDTPTDGRQFDRLLAQGDVIKLGQLDIQVVDTPGHTSDSITYRVGDAAFIGDTLFAPAFGSARCDFPGGNAEQLYDSIQKLYQLPPETRLFLCHDYPAKGKEPRREVTVRESLEHNIHVTTGTTRAEYVEMRKLRDSTLSMPRLILPALQVNIAAGVVPDPDARGVRYLRIPFDQSIEDLIRKNLSINRGPRASGRKQHWEQAYRAKVPEESSWYQRVPQLSLALIANTGLSPDASILDVGGGASTLVDHLLDAGYRDLTVLDISSSALAQSSARLGSRAQRVTWLNEDVTLFEPQRRYDLWHDRAAFHFLTEATDRQRYVAALRTALSPHGQAILATFAPGGPMKCSGLDIVQYDAAKMEQELGPEFILEEQQQERHHTPAGREQLFRFFRFRKRK
jgi:glyoxylase-like metal-dependent hydrolase (beta-lactamase superfamily II)/SAM-dependent methyltransferase